MSLNTVWGETIMQPENEETRVTWGQYVAFYMMFTGTQEITDPEAFLFRCNLWDMVTGGISPHPQDELRRVFTLFVGTRANVSAKTLHQFLNNDVKRLAKEKGWA